MKFTCPVCAYDKLEHPPMDFHICPSCGTEFWNDDEEKSHAELRHEWIANGAPWFFGNAPVGWNPWMQLISAGYGFEIPFHPVVRMVPESPMSRGFSAFFGVTELKAS